MDNEYIGREEAAERLGVSGKTLNRLANDGVLTRFRPEFGCRVYFSVAEIDAVRQMKPVGRNMQEASHA